MDNTRNLRLSMQQRATILQVFRNPYHGDVMTAHPRPTALILGITGGYGGQMAAALAHAGYALRALVRDLKRGADAADALGVEAELFEGNVLDADALTRAAAGCDVIVHGVNAPYHQWDPLVVQYADAVATLAEQLGATVLFPGNVYALPPGDGLTEDTPLAPPTRKGELRVAIEHRLARATERGARVIVLRCGDFYGVSSDSSWLSGLTGRARKGGAIAYPTALSTRHQWAYLPDVARAHVALLARADELPAFAAYHFEGDVVTGEEFVAAVRAAVGDPKRRVARFPWWALALASPFAPLLRELRAMRYLWDDEVIMSGERLEHTIGSVPKTPFRAAMAQTLAA